MEEIERLKEILRKQELEMAEKNRLLKEKDEEISRLKGRLRTGDISPPILQKHIWGGRRDGTTLRPPFRCTRITLLRDTRMREHSTTLAILHRYCWSSTSLSRVGNTTCIPPFVNKSTKYPGRCCSFRFISFHMSVKRDIHPRVRPPPPSSPSRGDIPSGISIGQQPHDSPRELRSIEGG